MEDLKEWLERRIKEDFERLGFKEIESENEIKENKPITGTITFLKGESAKRAAAFYKNSKSNTVQEENGEYVK